MACDSSPVARGSLAVAHERQADRQSAVPADRQGRISPRDSACVRALPAGPIIGKPHCEFNWRARTGEASGTLRASAARLKLVITEVQSRSIIGLTLLEVAVMPARRRIRLILVESFIILCMVVVAPASSRGDLRGVVVRDVIDPFDRAKPTRSVLQPTEHGCCRFSRWNRPCCGPRQFADGKNV